jgi:hypothetical protein
MIPSIPIISDPIRCHILNAVILDTLSAIWTVASLQRLKSFLLICLCLVVNNLIEFIIKLSVFEL